MEIRRYFAIISLAKMSFLACVMNPLETQASSSYNTILEQVDRDFGQATTREEKFSLISRPMNRNYVASLSEGTSIDFQQLYSLQKTHPADRISERTHALALAVNAADERRVQQFLGVVDNPLDISLLVGGFRQPYNMLHLVLDPVWPQRFGGSIKARLKIIDLLAAKGFDPNFIPGPTNMMKTYNLDVGARFYWNPPLVGYTVHGNYNSQDTQDLLKLRARLLLRGANPALGGSSFYSIIKYMDCEIKEAFQQVLEENLTNLTPVESAKAALRPLKDKKLKELRATLKGKRFNLPQDNQALTNAMEEITHVEKLPF